LLRSRCFCSFSFRSACRGAKSAGCPHERFLQRAAPWLFFELLLAFCFSLSCLFLFFPECVAKGSRL
jgi:hypothetical protein